MPPRIAFLDPSAQDVGNPYRVALILTPDFSLPASALRLPANLAISANARNA
jgi:hypothetical protein